VCLQYLSILRCCTTKKETYSVRYDQLNALMLNEIL
jgi:hypothetical protein